MSSCTFMCGRKEVRRRNGLTCLLRPGTIWTPASVGVCSNGTCAEIVEVNNEEPEDIENKVLVGTRCQFVRNEHLMQRKNGDPCVLSRAVFTGVPQLIGICVHGECSKRPALGPRVEQFTLKECEVRNVQLTESVFVAESCVATCRDYRTPHRANGIPCLLRYRSYSCYVFGTCQTYSIGQCYYGNCVDSESGWDIHV